jgi:serine/threonine protein kinase
LGEVINGYTIGSQIGSGGMGSINLARNHSNQVAKKVLNKELAVSEAFLQRFLYESKFLSKLSHYNIAQFYSVHEIDDSLAIVMEYVNEAKTIVIMINRNLAKRLS